jgi:CheY-like chemotaxis protein/anti-sigma regulatory factor (Ser/Thr protein kinase)
MRQVQAFLPDKGDTKVEDLHFAFIRNVQHELRTPLSIIQGYVELLHAGDLGDLAPEQQQALFNVVDHVHELRTLVERITILMAVEAHATVWLPLRLDEIVPAVVDGKRETALEAGLALEVHCEPGLPSVLGDPYQVQQAVDCLLENALKFTSSGGQIAVRMWAEPHSVCVAVTDTGIGMTDEQVRRVLATPFYQVDSSMGRRHRGFGLGLTLAQAVIEEHGGQLDVESQPGQGSRFTAKFPLVPPAAQAELPAEEIVAAHRVLIVDDEELVALTLQAGLEKLPNCEVVIATRGDQALQLFEKRPFDLLITDYRMPGADGMTLARQVRQRYPQTVVIMITAYGDHDLRELAARASIRCILDKPVSLEEIRQVTLEAFSQPGS